jgi:hypothetical protein
LDEKNFYYNTKQKQMNINHYYQLEHFYITRFSTSQSFRGAYKEPLSLQLAVGRQTAPIVGSCVAMASRVVRETPACGEQRNIHCCKNITQQHSEDTAD